MECPGYGGTIDVQCLVLEAYLLTIEIQALATEKAGTP